MKTVFRLSCWQNWALALLLCTCGFSFTATATQSVNYHYNNQGLVDEIDGPRTDVEDKTTFTYDTSNNLSRLTNALGQSWDYSDYNAQGLPSSITAPDGVTTTLSYDTDGHLTELQRGSLNWVYTYDAIGQLVSSTDPAGLSTTRTYDDNRHLTEIRYPDGTVINLNYDKMGNITARTESGGSLTIERGYEYDELGRLLTVVNGSGTTIAAYGYDTNSNVSSTRNANPVSRTLQYDALNRLVTETDELGYSHKTQYNSHDAVTQYTNGNSANTTYTRNGLDQITKQVSPDTGTTTYDYDDAGNLTGSTLADGSNISRSYDALNRLSSINIPNQLSITYGYDEGGATGYLSSAKSGNVNLSWTYNTLGQLTSQTQQQTVLVPKTGQTQSIADTVTYNYDSDGRLSSLRYPQGLIITYSYNTAGQIESIKSTLGSENLIQANKIEYETGGRLSELTYGNGLILTQRYNTEGALSELQVGSLWLRSYSYDDNGRLSSQIENGTTTDYGFDVLSRLNSEKNSQTKEYEYDGVGNRLSELVNQSESQRYAYVINSNRQNAVGSQNIKLNALGQPDLVNGRNLGWRADGALVHAAYTNATQAVSADYVYNALNQRSSKVVTVTTLSNGAKSTTVQRYTYGSNGQLLRWAWQRSDGQYGGQSYIWLGNKPVAMLQEETSTHRWVYLHTDQLNAPRFATNTAKKWVWSWGHDAFGKGNVNTDVDGDKVATDVMLRYPGQLNDNETGLFYNWHRYYNPLTGRYISSDPIGLAGGENTYAYVGNDPLGRIDPSGLCIGPLAIVCVAIADYGVEAAAVTEAAVLIGTDTPAPGASVGNLGTEIKAAQSVANECKPSAYSTIYEMTLQQSSYPGVSRARHFQEANESLLQAMERDPQFAQMINDAGVDLARTPTGLAPRTSPNGWTWHHEVDDGLMRLVPRSQHSSGSQYWDVLHPNGVGGYSIWGK